MKRIIIDSIVLVMAFLILSCRSSVIEFDLETNTVYTLENYPIEMLHIYMENARKSFCIFKVDTLSGSSRIKLDSLGENYKIIVERSSNLLPLEDSKSMWFVPSEIYEISHSYGDAATSTIFVVTDENGKVRRWFKNRQDYEKQIIDMENNKK